ncbi:hypothetical protein [Streptomyces sp. NBC_00443]|uniref:hypothetical protein n=1 Tax=Streptomyces sp. NBC_00443 TaxID=2975743 RepID=UPI002E1A58DC
MQRKDTPDTAASSGLSTDDLARPRDRRAPDGPPATSPENAPLFPGESTPTPSQSTEDEAAVAGSDTRGERAEADSTAQSQAQDQNGDAEDGAPQLLTPEDEEGFRTRWEHVQAKFVDDPRDAVHTADALVADVMQKLATTFADHKQELEGQWNRGEQANTEDLRQALRHYRSFFNRLLVT